MFKKPHLTETTSCVSRGFKRITVATVTLETLLDPFQFENSGLVFYSGPPHFTSWLVLNLPDWSTSDHVTRFSLDDRTAENQLTES